MIFLQIHTNSLPFSECVFLTRTGDHRELTKFPQAGPAGNRTVGLGRWWPRGWRRSWRRSSDGCCGNSLRAKQPLGSGAALTSLPPSPRPTAAFYFKKFSSSPICLDTFFIKTISVQGNTENISRGFFHLSSKNHLRDFLLLSVLSVVCVRDYPFRRISVNCHLPCSRPPPARPEGIGSGAEQLRIVVSPAGGPDNVEARVAALTADAGEPTPPLLAVDR